MAIYNKVVVRVQKENEIQKDILAFLRLSQTYAVRIPVERLAHNRKNPARGVADIVAILPGGRCLFLEVKTPVGKQEESQRQFQREVEAAGAVYRIARSVIETQKIIKELIHEARPQCSTT